MSESTITYTFLDLQDDVSEYMGQGRSPSDATTAKRRVNDAYRNFLTSHDWNFLKRSTVLTVEAGKWEYDLPDDFSEFVKPFYYPKDDSWFNLFERDEGYVMELRTGSGSTSGKPYVYALRNKDYSEGEGTRWEVIFHYQPDGTYTLLYTYRLMVNELVNDADLPVGGARYANMIRTYCLAEVENFDDEKVGVWTQKIPILMDRAVKMDNRNSARSLGTIGRGAGFDETDRRQDTLAYNDELL